MNENKFKFKKIFIIFLLLLTSGLVVFSLISDLNKKKQDVVAETDNSNIIIAGQTTSCYLRETTNKNGYSDIAWLRVEEEGVNLKGEFRNLPAETDSKIGLFEGLIVEYNQQNNTKKADVVWDTFAEGMSNKEQLIFEYGEEIATVYFGEMWQEGESAIYFFKDKNNLSQQNKMDKINCLELEERITVEKYVRDNIKNISTTKEVLGGSWYVTKITINYDSNTGEVEYEDGHILEKAIFEYNYDSESKSVVVINFKQV